MDIFSKEYCTASTSGCPSSCPVSYWQRPRWMKGASTFRFAPVWIVSRYLPVDPRLIPATRFAPNYPAGLFLEQKNRESCIQLCPLAHTIRYDRSWRINFSPPSQEF